MIKKSQKYDNDTKYRKIVSFNYNEAERAGYLFSDLFDFPFNEK